MDQQHNMIQNDTPRRDQGIRETDLKLFHPPRFDIHTEHEEALMYLEEQGYVVIQSVASPQDIQLAKDLFWDFMGTCSPGVLRDDISTWEYPGWVGDKSRGIIGGAFNHSEFNWRSRLLPDVKEAFAKVWRTEDLICSFDAGNAFRPWKHNPEWITEGGWWHVDQNSYNRPHRQGKVCVQGLVTYYDANEDTGGLCVIPKSHLEHDDVCQRSRIAKFVKDFVPLEPEEQPILEYEKILVCAKAGDLILWDSRTVHCNSPGITADSFFELSEEEREKGDEDLIRLVSYVCMMPYRQASSAAIESRKLAFVNRVGSFHWATSEIKVNWESDNPVDIESCSPEQLSLVGYRDSSCTIL
eukprot:TRINITY_DN971_c0_g2_i4.p1 TRINITY_DN971_c0_g2~~TRINITY_DN971_c0_g2_i4.p1  ORF type:complete len:355 (-),score=70.32 TRINITY_DN971_c0_g2_i4:456-1520(-)